MARNGEKKFVYEYEERSIADLRERANQRSGNFDSVVKDFVKLYKPREGKNVIRILPPKWKNAKHYGFNIFVNYNIGIDKQSYLSLSRMKNEPDPLLEAKRAAERAGDVERAKELNPTKRVAMWLIDRLAEDDGPQLWLAPFTFDRDLTNMLIDPDGGHAIWLDNPNEGSDVRFYKEGTGRNTNYQPAKMRILQPSSLNEDEKTGQGWIDYVTENPVPDVLNYYSYDHISLVYNGAVTKPVDADEDEEYSPRKARHVENDDDDDDQPRKRNKVTYDDDDDDDNRRNRSSDSDDDDADVRRAKSDDDDEFEEVDEDNDEFETDNDDDEDEDGGSFKKPPESIRDKIKSRRRYAD